MFQIDYATPENATGSVAEVYAMFPKGMAVPDPIQLYSASPRYLGHQMAIMGDYMADEAYEPALLAALRYIGASSTCFGFCTEFNRKMLSSMGLSAEEIDALHTDPAKAFDEREAALLALAAKAVADPDKVSAADVDAARAQGWTDPQIFECVAYTAQMQTVGTIFRTFAEK